MQNTYYIDTHSHMYLPHFDEDIDLAVERALQKKVSKIVLPNIDKESIEPLVALTNKYPNVFFPLMGLHPTHVKENHIEELDAVLSEFKNRNYHGIGEIGIDLYWDKTFFNEQCVVFRQQIEFALENNLPIVIHARDSFDEIIAVLEKIETSKFKGIFHAFTGTTKQAWQIIEFGFKIGIGGIVTFKNSGLADSIEPIDLEHMVLESDSPFLAPTPFRGKRNESSYIPLIASRIAEIKNVSLDEVAITTSKNAEEVFGI